MKKLIIIFLAWSVPIVTFAAPKTVMDLAKWLVTIMNMATAMLITLAIVIYFWGIVYNYNSISKDPAKMRAFLVWGVVAVFVMVSIWGIVALIKNSILI